jgi:hypothetical protein
MSTPQPPVSGDDQTPAEGTTPAPAKPAKTGAARTGAARTGASATRKPVTGARRPAAAKSSTNGPASDKPATAKPASRRTASSKAAPTPKPDDEGDVPSILETALAGHNASVRASVDAVESGAAAEPTATESADVPAAEVSAPTPEVTVAAEPDTDVTATTEPTIEAATEPTIEASTEPTIEASTEPTTEATAEAIPEGDLPTTEAPAATAAPDGTVPPASYRTVTDLAERLDDTRFFSSLFDFTFTNYVTRKLAGPVYVVGLVLIGLSTLLAIIYSLTVAIGTHSFLGAFVFLFGVIITLVGAILSVLLLRVGIEVFVAIIEIAQNTRGRKRGR